MAVPSIRDLNDAVKAIRLPTPTRPWLGPGRAELQHYGDLSAATREALRPLGERLDG